MKTLACFVALLLILPQLTAAQETQGAKTFKQEELEQMVAPIALYPDSLLSQILMASTYPLEVVQAARWAKQNENLKGDELASALEQQNWDPSVKSLVNFPEVLQKMNEKIDMTAKMGDAFLAQQKDVMDAVQSLRKKAETQGNLKTTQEQKVIVEKETQTIVIESADPQVVYVPTYNPTVVYGTWPYPAYPPYAYYPPAYYAPGAALATFGMGVAVGAAWGYAWGHCDWNRGDVNVNVNQNQSLNRNIDRSKYQNKVTAQGGQGKWQHNPEHRKGVSYRDQSTAQRYNRGGSQNAQTRDAYRGRAETGRQDLARGDRSPGGSKDLARADRSPGGSKDLARADRPGSSQNFQGRGDTASPRNTGSRGDAGGFDRSGTRQASDRSAFGGAGGSQTREASSRGRESLSASSSGGGASSLSRGGGGGGSSFSRGGGGGGGGRGGGGRR